MGRWPLGLLAAMVVVPSLAGPARAVEAQDQDRHERQRRQQSQGPSAHAIVLIVQAASIAEAVRFATSP